MTKVRDQLGPFRLSRLIRAGSHCHIWEAVKEGDAKKYVLKVLRAEKRTDKSEVARLKHEAEVGIPLSSPRLIKIHELREEKNGIFLVMDLFSEVNLKAALRKGHEGVGYLVPRIVEQAAEALYFLHGKGWIHCDVKPDNFLVNRDGDIKLIDFSIAEKKKTGLSKLFSGSKKTAQGTRSYMSPEQIKCETLDERSDVYSFGCVLFELLTGKPPYTGYNPDDLLSKHISGPIPSPLTANAGVSQDFADLIKKMMAKQKDQRPATMWEVLKIFRSIKPYKTPPRKPDFDVFADLPTVKAPDQLLRTSDKPL